MKKLYTLALGLLAALGVQAQVTIGSTNYATLAEAVAAAEAGATITINSDVTINDRIAFANDVTVEGANPDIKIIAEKVPKAMLLINATVTFKNLIYDGNNVAASAPAFECSASKRLTLENFKFENVNQTGNRTITVKGYTTLSNVSFENCTYAENIYPVLVGANDRLTVSGTGEYDVYIESNYRINASNFTGKLNIYLQNYNAGRLVVSGGNLANFTLGNAPEGYSLINNNGTLVLDLAKNIVSNETTGASYTSFEAAYNEAADNDVLVLLEDITLNSRQNIEKPLTIKGANSEVKIIRNFTNNILFNQSSGKHLTLENLVIDANNKANNKNELEVGNANLTLNNVTISNSVTTQNLFYVKSGRNLYMTNVAVENCTGLVCLANNGRLHLAQNNVIPAIQFVGAQSIIYADNELTNTTPYNIEISGYTPEAGQVIVNGCTEASKFNLASTDWHLESDGSNLVLAEGETTGIDGIVADENAPVEYYNLQGIRVENPENGIFIRRQGNKTTKVAL